MGRSRRQRATERKTRPKNKEDEVALLFAGDSTFLIVEGLTDVRGAWEGQTRVKARKVLFPECVRGRSDELHFVDYRRLRSNVLESPDDG